jgi:hypothetical protein
MMDSPREDDMYILDSLVRELIEEEVDGDGEDAAHC